MNETGVLNINILFYGHLQHLNQDHRSFQL